MAPDPEKTAADFVERMGLIVQADGLPRIAGRILGLMIVDGGPFSFADLAKRLRVSRASVSTNTRLLERLDVIERTGVPGDRQDYFKLRPQPYARMLRGYAERMQRARGTVNETREALPADHAEAHERLRELDAFYQALIESFQAVIENWEAGETDTAPERTRTLAKQRA